MKQNKTKKEIIGFTCGQFDLTHSGHYLMFEDCKKKCDYLIVGLEIDASKDRYNKHKPIQSLKERLIQIESCKYVDEVVIYRNEKQLLNLLKHINIDIRFIGEDWKGKGYTGDDLLIKVIFNKREHNYSTTNLIKRIKDEK